MKKKIAHFGAFNHNSYGDLLFPHIVENFIPEFDFVHVAPSSDHSGWSDQKPIISTSKAFSMKTWDGILVGGGDIVHSSEGFIWNETLSKKFGGLISLWGGASILSGKLGIPCAWNSPGVPFNIEGNQIGRAHV